MPRLFFLIGEVEMTSVLRSTKQISADSGYFIAIAAAQDSNVYTLASVLALQAAGDGALTRYRAGGTGAAGDLYRDMGRTIVATRNDGASLTFRKVQYVDPGSIGTNGVTGDAATATDDGYNTGYILLGLNGAGPNATYATHIVAKVAKYGV